MKDSLIRQMRTHVNNWIERLNNWNKNNYDKLKLSLGSGVISLVVLALIYGVFVWVPPFSENIVRQNLTNQNNIEHQDPIEVCDCIKKVKREGRWSVSQFGIKIWVKPRLESVKQACPKSDFFYQRKFVG